MATLRKDDKGAEVKKLQLLLNSVLKPSPHLVLDGSFGVGTESAAKRFQREHKLTPDGVIGPRTWEALGQRGAGAAIQTVSISSPDAPWLDIATVELGVHEDARPGKETKRIVDYHQTTTLKATTDEVPWCASFVNWAMCQAKLKGTNSAAAKSWLDWGQKLSAGRLGAVTVIKLKTLRKDAATGSASGYHVAFYISSNKTHLRLLGGNQRNRVKFSDFPLSDYTIEGYRWPKA
jgi:uncharacterized protein (TIGR02594 family)